MPRIWMLALVALSCCGDETSTVATSRGVAECDYDPHAIYYDAPGEAGDYCGCEAGFQSCMLSGIEPPSGQHCCAVECGVEMTVVDYPDGSAECCCPDAGCWSCEP